MPTNPIDYFTAVYGTPAWTDIVLSWDGTSTNYTLFVADTDISLVNGPYNTYTFVGDPDTRYDFRLETETVTGARAVFLTTYTTPLPAPSGFALVDKTATNVSLAWLETTGATSYEIADVFSGYTIVHSGPGTSAQIAGLTPSSRYSFAARSVLGSVRSRWSRPVTVTTDLSGVVSPGVYTFAPASTSVWQAGRPGSSEPGWRPAADDYYHGDGWVWGDTSGEQTTYFFYGSPNPFISIVGGTLTKVEVYVERNGTGGDPGAVLSHWRLHPYAGKPSGEPTPSDSEYDAGLLTRNQSAWVELPLSWGYSLLTNGAQKGVAWGAVSSRYQVANRPISPVAPTLGTLRFTVA